MCQNIISTCNQYKKLRYFTFFLFVLSLWNLMYFIQATSHTATGLDGAGQPHLQILSMTKLVIG